MISSIVRILRIGNSGSSSWMMPAAMNVMPKRHHLAAVGLLRIEENLRLIDVRWY